MRCARERRQTGVAAEVPGPGEEGERTGGCEHPEDGGGGGEGRSEEGAERRQEQGEQELPEPADPAVRAEEDHPDLFGEQVAPSRCVHGRAPRQGKGLRGMLRGGELRPGARSAPV